MTHAPNATKIGAFTPSSDAFAALVAMTAELKNARSAANNTPAVIAAILAARVTVVVDGLAIKRHGTSTSAAIAKR